MATTADRANWSRPWSAFPRWAEVRVPFKAPAAGDVVQRYNVQEVFAHNVITSQNSSASSDADDGSTHALEFDGRVVVNVTELQPDSRLGVTFADMCRTTPSQSTELGEGTAPSLLGYVALQSVVGKDDRGEEGYHVLRVNTKAPIEVALDTALFNTLKAVRAAWRSGEASFGFLPRSIRRSGSALIADIGLETAGGGDATAGLG
jgi:hypothetical protein